MSDYTADEFKRVLEYADMLVETPCEGVLEKIYNIINDTESELQAERLDVFLLKHQECTKKLEEYQLIEMNDDTYRITDLGDTVREALELSL